MEDLQLKCDVCGALVDEEDLFCANCGTQAPRPKQPTAQPTQHLATRNFQCQGCGASMSFDARASTLRCPFCDSQSLESKADANVLAPRRVLPFAQERDDALAAFRGWLKQRFWSPSNLARLARVTNMTPIYVPYWVFTARTHTYWTADSSQTPPGARGDWFPLFGENRSEIDCLLVGASGALSDAETHDIAPFDLKRAVPPEQVDLENVTVERFGLARKYARGKARHGINMVETKQCQQYVPGRCRNMKVNVLVSDLISEPVLLPVWIMAYRYKNKVYRFLLNGHSGKSTGEAPLSWLKIAAVVVAGGVVLLGLLVALAFFLGL